MAALIHKTSSRAQATFSLYIGKMAEYISAFGLFRGPAKVTAVARGGVSGC